MLLFFMLPRIARPIFTMKQFMVLISVCLSAARPVNSRALYSLCKWYPDKYYTGVAMECSGPRVEQPPLSAPASLKLLRLSGSNLRRLDTSTFEGRHLPELTSLSVTDGVLSTVGPDALCPLTALAQLDLSNNKLKELDPASFACNQHLRSLILSNNTHLQDLPTLASSSIEKLYVENCDMMELETSALAELTALKELHLNGNPRLDCSPVKQRLSERFPSLIVNCRSRSNNLSPPYVIHEKHSPQTSSATSLTVADVPQTSSSAAHISNAVPLFLLSALLMYFVFN